MNKEKIEYYSHLTVTAIGALLFGYIFIRYIFFLVLPFLLAWAVAFSVRPLAGKISSGTRIPHKVVSVILTAVILIGVIGVLICAVSYALGEAWDFFVGIKNSDALYDILSKIMNPIGGWLGEREGAEELERHIGEAIKGMMSSLLGNILSGVTSFISSVPRVLIFILVSVVSSIYFALDLDGINAFVKRVLPKKASAWLVNFKSRFLGVTLRYLRSYLILMMITFIIMLFGLLLLGVKYAVLLAFVIAVLDVLPLIGVGTVLVPWSAYQMLFGNLGVGIGLLSLFVICEIVRHFVEPKIVGKSLGIHPIVSIILLYVSYYVFGFFGLLLVPVVTVLINILINKDDTAKVN